MFVSTVYNAPLLSDKLFLEILFEVRFKEHIFRKMIFFTLAPLSLQDKGHQTSQKPKQNCKDGHAVISFFSFFFVLNKINGFRLNQTQNQRGHIISPKPACKTLHSQYAKLMRNALSIPPGVKFPNVPFSARFSISSNITDYMAAIQVGLYY